MEKAKKQLPKSARKINNPTNENYLAYEVSEDVIRDWKKLVEMGDFDSLEEIKEFHREVVEKYQLKW